MEIIAIWSKVAELGLPRYETATIMACAYASTQLRPEWNGVAKEFLKEGRYPEKILGRKDDLDVYTSRLEELHLNLAEIEYYHVGVRKDMQQIADEYIKGGQEAKLQLAQINQRTKSSPSMLFLGEIGENWGNGMLELHLALP